MNFHHSTLTTRRPQNTSSNFNEDAHCDNEVNLILEKNYNQHILEQAIYKEQQQQQQQQSVVVNQAGQYYFIPIREQSSTMALASNNTFNVTDGSSMLLTDPSGEHLFDYASTMNSSDLTAVNKLDNNFHFTDADLAALFVSSLVSTTAPPPPTTQPMENNNELSPNHTLDEVFLQQVNDLVGPSKEKSVGPPPGFENFHFDTFLDNSTTLSPTSTVAATAAAIQTQVSSSDTINFSQLLHTNIADAQQQQSTGGNVRSSSSSHSSFTSDEQSIFFPMSTRLHHSSTSSSSSQIASTNKSCSTISSTTTSHSNNSIAKPYIPNSLSSNTKHFSSLHTSNTTSPVPTKPIETETIIHDGDVTPNSFFTNGHTDFPGTKPTTTKTSSTNRQSSSSTSSSTSSSIDDALIQLSQQQKQQGQTHNKLFPEDSLSIFHFSSSKTKTAAVDHHHRHQHQQEQLAVNDNINFLVSMTASSTPVTPESPWQASNPPAQRKTQSILLQQETNVSYSPSRNLSAHMQELMESLNEFCYRGFDELNALIQEQRWVQNYLNVNSASLPSPSSPLVNLNGGTSCCSSQILIVPDYFIYKCQKVETTASHVYELLAVGRPELRLRELMFAFKSWKEAIVNAKSIHQEEETKLRLITEHSHSLHTTEAAFQAAFDRVCYAIRQLGNMTQQARAAFQYATLNVFQMSSRQQASQTQASNPLALAQFQAMQQQKSSTHRNGGSIRTTP